MVISKENIKRLREIINKSKKKDGYVDIVRERWSDEEVLDVYRYARKLERNRV